MSFRVATDRSRGRLRRLRRALAVILSNAVKLGRDLGFAESGRAALDPWFFDKLPGGLPLTAEGASFATPENNPARAEVSSPRLSCERIAETIATLKTATPASFAESAIWVRKSLPEAVGVAQPKTAVATVAAVEEVDSPEQRDTLIGKAKMDFRPQSEIA
jgi:hypothetical protein